MANIEGNVVMHGMSGKIGDLLVISRRNGKTIVSMAPGKRQGFIPGLIHERFKKAIVYAQAATKDPDLKKAYQAIAGPGVSAFNMAFVDFVTPPVIQDFDPASYTGAVGSTIKVPVTDDFRVKSVTVIITRADNTILEQGAAVADADGLHWLYTATQANATVAGSKITVQASDLPGNLSKLDKVLS